MCFNFPEKLCTVSIYRVRGHKFKVLWLKSMAKIKKHASGFVIFPFIMHFAYYLISSGALKKLTRAKKVVGP